VRRALLVVFGVPTLVAAAMTAIDAYRRHARPLPPSRFPTLPPTDAEVGEATLTAYTFGRDLFDDMLDAIDKAERQVFFETYIWKGDDYGQRFKTALSAAVARGVEVYCVYDSFANLVVPPRFKQFPAGMKVLRYPVYPAGIAFFDLRRYGRDHRKLLVVDDKVGYVGGYNVGSAYATEWRDTHLRITGPAVLDLTRAFADFWNLNRKRTFGPSERPLLVEAPSAWEPAIRFHRNVPRLLMFPIRAMYLEAITRASKNIWLTTAYFLPDQDFIDALKEAARRGVDVRILVPLKSNHIVTDWISRGYYSQLLDAGVRIFRYRDAMIHAKTATIDGSWSTVGTANIDRISLTGNYELNVEVIDEDLAATMERIFEVDESNSLELSMAEWQARDVHRKFTEFVLGPLRPFL